MLDTMRQKAEDDLSEARDVYTNTTDVTKSDTIEQDIIQLQQKEIVKPTNEKIVEEEKNKDKIEKSKQENLDAVKSKLEKLKYDTEVKKADTEITRLEEKKKDTLKHFEEQQSNPEITEEQLKSSKETQNIHIKDIEDKIAELQTKKELPERVLTKEEKLEKRKLTKEAKESGMFEDSTSKTGLNEKDLKDFIEKEMRVKEAKVVKERKPKQEPIEDLEAEINKRTEIYKSDEKARIEDNAKDFKGLSDAQKKANELDFQKKQYEQIRTDIKQSQEVRKQATSKLKELNKIKVKDFKATPEQEKIAEQKFFDQYKVPERSQDTTIKREMERKAEYKKFEKLSGKDPRKLNYKEVSATVISNGKKLAERAKKSMYLLEKELAKTGEKFDINNITDSQRKRFNTEINIVEDLLDARHDMKLFKEKKINLKEFMHREENRIFNRDLAKKEKEIALEKKIEPKEVKSKDNEDIKLSARKSETLEQEEVAGMVTKADTREIDLSKVNKSKTEVMKEFMAKDNVRQVSVNQLPKVLAHESGLRTMSIAKSGDDVFERQFALAHQDSNYEKANKIEKDKKVTEPENKISEQLKKDMEWVNGLKTYFQNEGAFNQDFQYKRVREAFDNGLLKRELGEQEFYGRKETYSIAEPKKEKIVEKESKDLTIKAPEGVNKEVWDKAQREIFNEARARIENNPLLIGKIQGERKFFTETGKVIGDKTETFHKLLREENRSFNRDLAKKEKEITSDTKIEKTKKSEDIEESNKEKIIRLSKQIKSDTELVKKYKDVEYMKTLVNERKIDIKKYREELKTAKEELSKEIKPYQQILKEEIEKGNKEIRRLNAESKKALESIAPTYEQIKVKVDSWETGKKLNNAESIAKEIVEDAKKKQIPKSQFKKNIDKVKAYFKDQTSDSKVSKDFKKILTSRIVNEENVAKRTENLKAKLDTLFKGYKTEDVTDAILKTDYNAIKEFKNEKEAKIFEEENDNIYQIAKEYIDQSAKAIGESSEQIGFFRNNAKAIAEELGMPYETVPIIDKLISIKAMTPERWKVIEEIRDTKDFKFVMDVIGNNKKRSSELFGQNPNQQIKGFVQEVYSGKYRLDEQGKKVYDAETKRELGALPNKLENKKVGRSTEIEHPNFKSIEEKSEYAKEHKLKISENGTFRKILSAEKKNEVGRSKNFSEILSKTTQSIDAKEVQQLISKKIIDEIANKNEMFSQTFKEGYRPISEYEVRGLPKVLRETLAGRYILEAYDKRLLGRDEVRMYSGTSQVGKIADRLLRETTTAFKQNNVLKNISSYVNATLVNQMLGSMSGVNPAKLLKYQTEAISEIKKVENIENRIAILKAQGKNTKKLQDILDKSLLYKMEQAGLAVNRLEVAGGGNTLMGQMLSDVFRNNDTLNKIANEVLLSEKSYIGSRAFKMFGVIDVQGRYTIAKNAMDNGKTLEVAVNEANGLFSDMSQIAPAFIEFIDKYPLIPFAKWFSLVTPRLMKLTKDNPVKALLTGMTVWAIQEETDTSMATVNPLESVVNFGDDAITLEYLNAVDKEGFGEATYDKTKTFYVPKIYREIQKELVQPEQHEFFLKRKIKGDFQPLTQKLIG